MAASASMILVRCGVSVEVNGRPIHADKSAKDLGVQIVEPVKGPSQVRVVGFKREVRFSYRDVDQKSGLVDGRLAEGRLAVILKDRTKVILVKAQPAQLELVIRCLRGSTGSVGSGGLASGPRASEGAPTTGGRPHPSAPRPQRGDEAPPPAAKRRRAAEAEAGAGATPATPARSAAAAAAAATAGTPVAAPLLGVGAGGGEGPPAASLADLPTPLLDALVAFEPCPLGLARLSESCQALAAYVLERRQPTFRLGASRGAGIPAERVVQGVARRFVLATLDLTGYADFTATAAAKLADVLARLGRGAGGGLRALHLRGCKGLTDASVRRLLANCPRLQTLDLLDIPRLSNQALRAHLPFLSTLAVGSLGRAVLGVGPRVTGPSTLQTISSTGALLAAPQQKPQSTVKFTAALLSHLAKGSDGAGGGAGSAELALPPLTHAVLAHCLDIEVVPRLPETLRLLDLRGASLRGPGADLRSWRPLAGCGQLEILCLAGNGLLAGAVLQVLLESLPPETRLRALDLSGTRADAGLVAALVKLPAAASLTHLRLASCPGLQNLGLAALLRARPLLQVLDVAGCKALEHPFDAVNPASLQFPNLRLLGIGQTDFAAHLDVTRRSLADCAPNAKAVPGSLDVFGGYASFPPALL